MLYANLEGTGYKNPIEISAEYATGVCFHDLNGDGHMDLVVADRDAPGIIYWSNETGTYSTSNKLDLNPREGRRVASGDFNGDGLPDLAFAVYGGSNYGSCVFLNHEGTFNTQPDIRFTDQEYYYVDVGDLNVDGYDDILFGGIYIFYGDEDGPDTTPNLTMPSSSRIKDVDQDGFLDLLSIDGASVKVYLGSTSGPSTTPDYTLSTTSGTSHPNAGDFNGDGYLDIVVTVDITSSEKKISIFEGASDGWSSSRMHEDIVHADRYYFNKLVDIDLDGYDDLLLHRA